MLRYLRILDARPAVAMFSVLEHLVLLIHFLLLIILVRKMMLISSVSFEESLYRIPVFSLRFGEGILERTFSSGN